MVDQKSIHRTSMKGTIKERRWAAIQLGINFACLSDKEQAWYDLHRLADDDEDGFVMWGTADAIGSAFPHIPDNNKEQALNDLYRLARKRDRVVRMAANHSLGNAFIFKATEKETAEDFKMYFIKSIEFFEKSVGEQFFFNPSRFCLPFYRLFYTLTFNKTRTKYEVEGYLADARIASIVLEGSDSQVQLLKSLRILVNTIEDISQGIDSDAGRSALITYNQNCEVIKGILDRVKKSAPFAAKLIMELLLTINKPIKELFEEVRRESENVCKNTGSPKSKLGCTIGNHITTALVVDDPAITDREIECILGYFERWCIHSMPEGETKTIVQRILRDANDRGVRTKVTSIRIVSSIIFPDDGPEPNRVPYPYELEGVIHEIFASTYQK